MIYIIILLKTLCYIVFSFIYKRKYVCIYDNIYHDFDEVYSKFTVRHIPYIKIKASHNIYESIENLKKLALSKIVITNISHNDISQVLVRRGLIVIYSCHGGGCYKKMGYAARDTQKQILNRFRLWRVHGRYTYILSTSENLNPYIAKNYNVPQNRILCLGAPRTDRLFKHSDRFFSRQNENIIQKKIILYAPTFREIKGKRVLPSFFSEIYTTHEELRKYTIIFRAHPTIKNYTVPPDWIDASQKDYFHTLEAADILITDYSSILFDFSYYRKPIFLLVPDEQEFRHDERDLWVNPAQLVGQNVCRSSEELIRGLEREGNQGSQLWDQFMGACDGYSSDRLANLVFSLIKE